MKKMGLIVAFLAVVMVLAGCPAAPPQYTPENGTGAVRINFSDVIGRATILPDEDIDVFAVFELQFTPGPITKWVDNSTPTARNGATFVLAPGTYDLLVIGYLDGVFINQDTAPTTPVAGRPAAAATTTGATPTVTPAPIVVSNGGTTNIAINLQAFAGTPTGGILAADGTFDWNIGMGTSTFTIATGSTMIVTPIASSTAALTVPLNVPANRVDSDVLAPGFYYVDFHIETTAGGEINFRHILHIYQNFTSSFSYVLNDNLVITIADGTVVPTWTFDNPKDLEDMPLITWENDVPTPPATVAEAGTVNVDISGTVTTTLRITNTYDTYQWFHGTTSLGTTNSLVVNTTTSFAAAGVYMITVVGTTTGEPPYSTFIYINVQ